MQPIQIQITSTINSTKDFDELMKNLPFFNKFRQEKIIDSEKTNVQDSTNVVENRTCREFNELKEYEDKNENEKNDEKIAFLEQQLKNVVEKSERLENENFQLKNTKEELENQLQKYKIELEGIKEEKAILQNEKADLRKQLDIYEPTLNGDVNYKYFEIENLNLSETVFNDAPFIGKVSVDGNAIFNFNEENGPHWQYSQNPSALEEFCEIVETIDGANHISLGKWGKGKYYSGGLLKVDSKAKIKLTRE